MWGGYHRTGMFAARFLLSGDQSQSEGARQFLVVIVTQARPKPNSGSERRQAAAGRVE